jgi:rhodanese-related sulfurtransferase
MSKKLILFGLITLLISTSAHAIPPPDAVISIWQSLLQFLGVASVFIGGAIFSVRQFFGHYIVGWKRTAFYVSLAIGFAGILWLMLGSQIAKADTVKPIAQGELIPIQTLIKREKADWVRKWLSKTVVEMQQELNLAREHSRLKKLSFGTVHSFSPKALNQLVQSNNKDIYVLDIREENERSRFGIRADGIARYGDLVHNVMPKNIPENVAVVVLCHSGLRGYLGASLLKNAGIKHVAFLQGGLSAWSKQGFDVHGDPEYKAKKRWLLSKKEARKVTGLAVQVDPEGSTAIKGLSNLLQLPYETAATSAIKPIIKASKQQAVLLACNTYSGCFHSTNLAWLIEKNGGKVLGIYDVTGDFMSQFFD